MHGGASPAPCAAVTGAGEGLEWAGRTTMEQMNKRIETLRGYL